MQTIDYLIVGQGIAGTLMAHFLLEAQQSIVVIDSAQPHGATKAAAGIINPITGRRYVKSWRVEELIPFAANTYQQIEQKLGIQIFYPYPIIRTLFNEREENDWWKRSVELGYEKYILEQAYLGSYQQHTLPAFSYGELQHSAQVQIGKLANAYRNFFLKQNIIITQNFDFEAITLEKSFVRYQDFQAKKIIFCEGYYGKFNPFFSHLPFRGAKGEALLVRIPNAKFDRILKHRIFVVPLGEDLYWIGATNNQTFEDETPTLSNRQTLENHLREILQLPFEVVAHEAGVRPTVKDRRPFLGLHPQFNQLAIFNGLGTKGASLAPFFAKQMADFLTTGRSIDEAVDIKRFETMV